MYMQLLYNININVHNASIHHGYIVTCPSSIGKKTKAKRSISCQEKGKEREKNYYRTVKYKS